MVGPLVGALLYGLGGYSCPFWTLGAIFVPLYPLVMRTLATMLNGPDGAAVTDSES